MSLPAAAAPGVPTSEFKAYELYGLRISSQLPLPAPLTRSFGATSPSRGEVRPDIGATSPSGAEVSHEIEAVWGETRAVPREIPEGTVVAQLMLGPGAGNVAVRRADGYLLRYLGCCEFLLSADLKRIVAHPDPKDGAAYAPLFLSGNVMAIVLTLLGRTVLHASAVEINGVALAVVGASGQGKSTMAALCCARGASLVTDDLVALSREQGEFTFPRGPNELRLRSGARELCGHWADAGEPVVTVDGRHLARPPVSSENLLKLGAIVLPSPNRESRELQVTRLSPKEAFQGIVGHSRWGSWRDAAILKRETGVLEHLVKSVPVYRAEIPWGPPFDPRVVEPLLDLIR